MPSVILNVLQDSSNQTSKKKLTDKKPLTALAVKNHKQGWLADTPPYQGLRLKANLNGSKTWVYRYRISQDKLKQITLGSWPGMELAEARAAYLVQKKLKESGIDPRRFAETEKERARAAEFEASKSVYTFGEMIEDYLCERIERDRKSKGAQETRRLLENDLGSLRELPVIDSTGPLLHNHIRAISARAPNVARVFRMELKRAWQYAVNIGRTESACLINSDMGGKLTQGKRERALSEQEVAKLIPWMENYSSTVSDVLTLVLFLGLRSGEVCKLRDEWLHQQDDGWWIVIPRTEMKKGHSDHWVPLEGTALRIANQRKGQGFWFPSRTGGHIAQKVLGVEVYAHSGRSKAKIYKNKSICPVSNWAPNDLRKTARTHLAALGCPYEVAETILHHKLPGVGGLYNQHKYQDEKRQWLIRLGNHLEDLKFGSSSFRS